MDAVEQWTRHMAPSRERSQRETWILGQPPLRRYLKFVQGSTFGGENRPGQEIVDEWRAANDIYYDIAESEAGLADEIEIADLDASLDPLVDAVRADMRYRRAFALLPTRFAMVEIEKLVVPQPHVNLDHVARLVRRLGPSPSPEALFRFCQPLDRTEAPMRMRQTGSQRYLFWSESSDFRFHEAVLLRPEQITGHEALGPVGGVVGLTVGFGSNFLSLIQSDDRLLVHNGHHRAYAMRELGITHAPCIIQTVTRLDELSLVASSDVCNAPAFYFKAPRPPLLKDFFDERLRKELEVKPILNTVEVSFEVHSNEIFDFDAGVP